MKFIKDRDGIIILYLNKRKPWRRLKRMEGGSCFMCCLWNSLCMKTGKAACVKMSNDLEVELKEDLYFVKVPLNKG